ncbi:glutathione-regulated potassium-efflux system oxidoreductase KefF [Oxalobacteraceae bacterium OM1]|nr:glutathione-regulated potassium-efflux system oxidoreductase KefF [Oxalobacteraceae bacterium OM1]
MTPPSRILIVYAHPSQHRSHANRRMRDAAARLSNVVIRDLYETYPDFHIDVPQEQELLSEADLVVLQHPLQWYSMPGLMKEWLDVVFEHGWAYGHEGNALRGKDLWLAVTTGGPAESYSASGYHQRPFKDFLAPYEQTAFLCGLRWHPPLVLHGARRADDAALQSHAARYAELLMAYPNWHDGIHDTPPPVASNVYIHDPDAP